MVCILALFSFFFSCANPPPKLKTMQKNLLAIDTIIENMAIKVNWCKNGTVIIAMQSKDLTYQDSLTLFQFDIANTSNADFRKILLSAAADSNVVTKCLKLDNYYVFALHDFFKWRAIIFALRVKKTKISLLKTNLSNKPFVHTGSNLLLFKNKSFISYSDAILTKNQLDAKRVISKISVKENQLIVDSIGTITNKEAKNDFFPEDTEQEKSLYRIILKKYKL